MAFHWREIGAYEFQSSGKSTIGMNILSSRRGLTTREAVRSPIRRVNSVQHETPGNLTKDKDTRKSKDDAQLKEHTGFITPCRGVMTRGKARLKTLRNNQEENLASKASPWHENSAWILTPEATGFQSGGIITRSVSKGYPATSSQGNSGIRRSSRLKNTKKEIH